MLTASFVRRSISTGEESRDAREFAVVLVKTDGDMADLEDYGDRYAA